MTVITGSDAGGPAVSSCDQDDLGFLQDASPFESPKSIVPSGLSEGNSAYYTDRD